MFVFVVCFCVFVFVKTTYNKTIIRFLFCDILNYQGLGKCYQPRRSTRLITLILTLIIPDITKTSSNNCLLLFTTCKSLFILLKELCHEIQPN